MLSVALLVLLWSWLVDRLLTTTERPASVRERGGLGWFAVAPGTPGGAIAARSLVYWLRDRRYLVNLVVIPIAAAVTTVPLLIAGVPLEIVALVPVPFAALFLGWLPHNDVAYDSTAVWMHIASGVRGVSDRVGRLVPVLLVGIPLLAVAIPVAIGGIGRWAVLPALIGVCASLFLSRPRPLEHLVGRRALRGVAAGREPVPAAAAHGSSGAIAQALVHARRDRAQRAGRCGWAWLAIDGDIDSGDDGAVGRRRHRARASAWPESRSARSRSSAAEAGSWSSPRRRDEASRPCPRRGQARLD